VGPSLSISHTQFMSRPPSSSPSWTTASGTPPRPHRRFPSLFTRSWIKTLKRSNTADKLYAKYLRSYKNK